MDRRTVSVLITILVFAAFMAVIWLARLPIITLVFGIFFAKLLEPVVERFGAWFHVARGKAVAITYAAIVVGLVIYGFTVGPRIVDQAQNLPGLIDQIRSGDIAFQLGSKQGWSTQTQMRIQAWLVAHRQDIAGYVRNVEIRLQQLAANIPWILLVPVFAVFFLTNPKTLRESLPELTSASQHRRFIEGALDDLETMLAQFVRAQLMMSFFSFVAYALFLLIARVPYAFALAAIGGVLEFIPFAGPLLTLAILAGTAFVTGYKHWGIIVAFWLVWRGIQDYVNTPRVMGEGLDLHPLLVIFAILAGGEIAGMVGIFLSTPAVAALRILWMNWRQRVTIREAA